jgi:hypothetical protein
MITDTITEDRVITIDYGMSLEDMIAAGKYDWKNSHITARNFPVEGTGIVQFETKVFHSGRVISSEDAVAAIKADDSGNPCEPAGIEHLLVFGSTYPAEQCRYPIVALSSVTRVLDRHYRGVPFLRGNYAERYLDLTWDRVDWFRHFRFLAVRKLPSVV